MMDQTSTHKIVIGSNSMPLLRACLPVRLELNATLNEILIKKRKPIKPRSKVWFQRKERRK